MSRVDLVKKLTSRKFWLALAGLVTGIITFVKEPTTDAQTITSLILALGSVVAYCIGEGLADAANAQAEPTVIYVPSDAMFDEHVKDEEEETKEETEATEEGGEK